MVRNHIKTLLCQSQTLALHTGCDHLERLACTYTVCKQGIISIKDMCHRIFLMLHQLNFRIHSDKLNVTAIIFPWPDAVKPFIINFAECFPSAHILKNPLFKLFPDQFLLLLCQGGFFPVQYPVFPIRIMYCVIDFCVTQIQCILQQPVSICPLCSVSCGGKRVIAAVHVLSFYVPLSGHFRILYFDTLIIDMLSWCMECFCHELCNIVRRNPCYTKPCFNLGSVQIFRLYPFQCLYIDHIFRVVLCKLLCNVQLLPDIPGKILVGWLPFIRKRILEDNTRKLLCDLFLCFLGKLHHIRNIHFCLFPDRYRQCLTCSVYRCYRLCPADRPFRKYVCFPLQLALFVQKFKGSQKAIAAVHAERPFICIAAE